MPSVFHPTNVLVLSNCIEIQTGGGYILFVYPITHGFLVYEFVHLLKNSTCLEGNRKLVKNPWPHVQLKYTYNYIKNIY
jgi:hypothetical protein